MGSPRITLDIDVCYRRTRENLERLARALSELKPTLRGAPPDVPVILDAKALAFGNNYTFDTIIGKVDFLGWVEPHGGYEQLLSNAQEYPVGEMTLKVIGLDDLIRVKEHISRRKDEASLVQLLAIKRMREEEGRR